MNWNSFEHSCQNLKKKLVSSDLYLFSNYDNFLFDIFYLTFNFSFFVNIQYRYHLKKFKKKYDLF